MPYHHFYGDSLVVECPTGSGNRMNLGQVAQELRRRLARLFLPDAQGVRPNVASDSFLIGDPHSRDLVLFHEHFHADTGRGLGATHQTGWTALIANILMDLGAEARTESSSGAGAPGVAGQERLASSSSQRA